MANFGVRQLLDVLAAPAPAPHPRLAVDGMPRPIDAPFAGFVFKIRANMNKAHRDQVAFCGCAPAGSPAA